MAIPKDNFPQFQREINKLQVQMVKRFGGREYEKLQRKAIRRAMAPYRKDVRSRVPRGETGGLRKAVKVRIVRIGDKTLEGRVGYIVGGTVSIQQILAVEWGTGIHPQSITERIRQPLNALTIPWDKDQGQSLAVLYFQEFGKLVDEITSGVARNLGKTVTRR